MSVIKREGYFDCEPPEPDIVYTCDECGDTICEGEVYYSVDDKKYCEYCMQAMMHIAEPEDPLDLEDDE